MPRFLIICIFTFLTEIAFCQKMEAPVKGFKHKNSLQFELLGHGLFYSVIYERILISKQYFKTSIQTGFSIESGSAGRFIVIPTSINEIFSFKNHHIEIGVGVVPFKQFGKYYDDDDFYFSGRLGYRYQKPQGRFVMRAGFTPLVDNNFSDQSIPTVGLAFGFCF